MKYLFLSPHPDDAELACGATIARLVEENHQVYIAVFSDCEISLNEMYRSHEALGAKTLYFSYPRREFDRHRQKILDDLIGIREKFQFNRVFIPDMSDIHQDHQVIGMEGLRCFKQTADVYTYAHIHNQVQRDHNLFYVVGDHHLARKMEALGQYSSQFHRHYFTREAITSVMKSNGVQCGVPMAEVFRVIRQLVYT